MNTMHPRGQDEGLDRDDGDQEPNADPRSTGIQRDEGADQQAADPNIINKPD